jgi:3-hydroxyisobutyrate dehydrogenase-like beta-hydroxyacid dehydrogenase
MTDTENEPVGLIGLGMMGAAIAGLLLRDGTRVVGYDVEPAKNARLAAAGGEAAGSVTEVAAACPVVLTSLPAPSALHDVVAGLVRAGRAGLLLIELSTFALPDKERARQSLAAAHGRLVDAPLSGTGAQARKGDLAVFVSADDPADREAAIDVAARFTRAQFDVGAFGNGMRFKYIANHLVAVHNVAAAEALVLAEQAGLDLGLVLRAVSAGAGTSRMLEVRGPLIIDREYEATIRLEVFLKDVALIGGFAADVGAPTPLFEASRQLYLAASAEGRGQQDTASVAEVLREQAARLGEA